MAWQGLPFNLDLFAELARRTPLSLMCPRSSPTAFGNIINSAEMASYQSAYQASLVARQRLLAAGVPLERIVEEIPLPRMALTPEAAKVISKSQATSATYEPPGAGTTEVFEDVSRAMGGFFGGSKGREREILNDIMNTGLLSNTSVRADWMGLPRDVRKLIRQRGGLFAVSPEEVADELFGAARTYTRKLEPKTDRARALAELGLQRNISWEVGPQADRASLISRIRYLQYRAGEPGYRAYEDLIRNIRVQVGTSRDEDVGDLQERTLRARAAYFEEHGNVAERLQYIGESRLRYLQARSSAYSQTLGDLRTEGLTLRGQLTDPAVQYRADEWRLLKSQSGDVYRQIRQVNREYGKLQTEISSIERMLSTISGADYRAGRQPVENVVEESVRRAEAARIQRTIYTGEGQRYFELYALGALPEPLRGGRGRFSDLSLDWTPDTMQQMATRPVRHAEAFDPGASLRMRRGEAAGARVRVERLVHTSQMRQRESDIVVRGGPGERYEMRIPTGIWEANVGSYDAQGRYTPPKVPPRHVGGEGVLYRPEEIVAADELGDAFFYAPDSMRSMEWQYLTQGERNYYRRMYRDYRKYPWLTRENVHDYISQNIQEQRPRSPILRAFERTDSRQLTRNITQRASRNIDEDLDIGYRIEAFERVDRDISRKIRERISSVGRRDSDISAMVDRAISLDELPEHLRGFYRILAKDPINEGRITLTAREAAQELVAGTLFITQPAGGTTRMVGETAKAAKIREEKIAKEAQWLNEPYRQITRRLFDNRVKGPEAELIRGIHEVLRDVVPDYSPRNIRGRGMMRRFSQAISGAAEETLNIPPNAKARNAIVDRTIERTRSEARVRRDHTTGMMRHTEEGELVGFDIPLEGRTAQYGNYEEIIEAANETALETHRARQQTIRDILDLDIRAETAKRQGRAVNNPAQKKFYRHITERHNAMAEEMRQKLLSSDNPADGAALQLYHKLKALTFDSQVNLRLHAVSGGERGTSAEQYLEGLNRTLRVAGSEQDELMRRQAELVRFARDIPEGYLTREHLLRLVERATGPFQYQRPGRFVRMNETTGFFTGLTRRNPATTRTLFDFMQARFGWDDYMRGVAEEFARGGKVSTPFAAETPDLIMDQLRLLQENNAVVRAVLPKFRERYQTITRQEIPPPLEFRIQRVRELSEGFNVPDARTFGVTYEWVRPESMTEAANVLSAWQMPRYRRLLAESVQGRDYISSTGELTKQGLQAAREIALGEIRAAEGAITQEVQYRVREFGRAVPRTREEALARAGELGMGPAEIEALRTRPLQEILETVAARDFVPLQPLKDIQVRSEYYQEALRQDIHGPKGRPTFWRRRLHPGEDLDIAIEQEAQSLLRTEEGGLGTFAVARPVPHTEAMNYLDRLTHTRFQAEDLLGTTYPRIRNTVATRRHLRNVNVARRGLEWRNPDTMFNKTGYWDAAGRLITKVLPLDPVTGAQQSNAYDDVFNMIRRSMRQQSAENGVSWDAVRSLSEAFGEGKSPFITLPPDRGSVAAAREVLGLGERERRILAPLAGGRKIYSEALGGRQVTLGELVSQARFGMTLSTEELVEHARARNIAIPMGLGKRELREALLERSGLRPSQIIEEVASDISDYTRKLLHPDVVASYSSEKLRDQALRVIAGGVEGKEPPITPPHVVEDGLNTAKKAADVAEYYRRASFKEFAELWKKHPTVRYGTVGALGLAALGIVHGVMRRRDHTQQGVAGPPLLPGGSAYETMPPPGNPMLAPGGGYTPTGSQGTIYRVRANGSFDPSVLQRQMGGLVGGNVSGTIYSGRPRPNPNNSTNYVMRNYG